MKRREFLRFLMAAGGAAMGPARTVASWADSRLDEHLQTSNFAEWVNPLIGTGWRAHTFPGPTLPFGLAQLSPDTSGPPRAWYEWDHGGGYYYSDAVLAGFTHTHIQGTGAPELGDLLLMPVVEERNWAWEEGKPGAGYCSLFSHAKETAQAGYYAVYLQTPQVQAEMTATTRCGMHRYSYSAAEKIMAPELRRGILLDMVHGLGSQVYHAELNLESPGLISGSRFTHGWAADRQIYFVMEFSRPMLDGTEILVDEQLVQAAEKRFSGTRIKARFTFDLQGEDPSSLLIRAGISGTSIEGARKNLQTEIPTWDFDATRQQAVAHWDEALGRLEASLPGDSKRVFYTASYHGLTSPITFNDVDGSYRGQDRKNHANPGFTKYTMISPWDICRSEFPFLTLMQPERINDLMQTLLSDYKELNQGSLPYLPLWGNESWSQTGFHVVSLILGAYVRGFRSFDVEAAYAAMRQTALIGAVANGNRELLREFQEYGYVLTGPHKESVFFTLDFAYDCWCVAAMAKLLGKEQDAAYFSKQALNYRNIFDAKTGFMRGKTADGQWRTPFRPDEEYWEDYTETDAWQATFTVMHDIQGLISLYGGDAPFAAKLDALFSASPVVLNAPPDITGLIGQDAQGNEASNHIPYLYVFAGEPWKTQYWIRKIMTRWYTDTPDGIPGNDDVGQLSSWLVLSALGFYPVNAANGVYVIGSPLVHRSTLNNSQAGTTFTVVAENNSLTNVYVQDVRLNGSPLLRSWISHDEILAGGTLTFRMGPIPNKQWAASPKDRPPSGLIPA